MNRLLTILVLIALISSCASDVEKEKSYDTELSFWDSMKHPKTNEATPEKIALGERLFFDPILSSDTTISCGSCHKPSLAFADSLAFSLGVEDKRATRNTPTIVNAGFLPHFMAEGGVKSLERQVLAPLENELEMNVNVITACERLNADADYKQAFMEVWSDSATPFTLTRSIAAFERTIVGGTSRYDEYMSGNSSALSAKEISGMELFTSEKLACSTCHSGPLFTSHKNENNGLDSVYTDNGAFRLTLKTEDLGKFKVPTLRNISLTAPYMHDGRFSTLSEVVNHYESGGKNHPNKHSSISGFELSNQEREALILFLHSLTDSAIHYGSR